MPFLASRLTNNLTKSGGFFLRDRVIAADAAPDPRVKEGNGIRAKAAQYLSYLWILPSSSLAWPPQSWSGNGFSRHLERLFIECRVFIRSFCFPNIRMDTRIYIYNVCHVFNLNSISFDLGSI